MAIITGTLTDVGLDSIDGALTDLEFVPNVPFIDGGALRVGSTLATLTATRWEVDLAPTSETSYYRIIATWVRGGVPNTEEIPFRLRVPEGGGDLSEMPEVTFSSERTWVGLTPPTDPKAYTWWLEAAIGDPDDGTVTGTGMLRAWVPGSGWVVTANLKGPKGWGVRNPRASAGRLLFDTYDGNTIEVAGFDAGALPVGPPANMTLEVIAAAAGDAPTGTISGTAPNYKLTLRLPPGPRLRAEAETLTPGTAPTAQISGTYPEQTIRLGLPSGLKGDTGAPANLTVTVTTLPAGSDATATLTGTAPNYSLALGVPKGDPGAASAAIVDGDPSATSAWPSARAHSEDEAVRSLANAAQDAAGSAQTSAATAQAAAEAAQSTANSKANASHKHPASDIDSGVFDAARIPLATATARGAGRIATQAQVGAGTGAVGGDPLLVTPATLAAWDVLLRPNRNRCVIVGSSNAVAGSTMWGAKLCAAMGWTEHNHAIGGTSYTSTGAGQNFQGQLTTARNALSASEREAVGHVFIADASNNIRGFATYAAVKSAAAAAYAYAATEFPNARIIVLPVVWPSDTEKYWNPIIGPYGSGATAGILTPAHLSIVASAMRDAAADIPRVMFIEQSWTWLTGRDEMMGAANDVHPGALGNTLIANYIAKALRGESPIGAGGRAAVVPAAGGYYALGGPASDDMSTYRTGWDVRIEGAMTSVGGATGVDSDWAKVAYGYRPTRNRTIAARFSITGSVAANSDRLVPVTVWPDGTLRVRSALPSQAVLEISDWYSIG